MVGCDLLFTYLESLSPAACRELSRGEEPNSLIGSLMAREKFAPVTAPHTDGQTDIATSPSPLSAPRLSLSHNGGGKRGRVGRGGEVSINEESLICG